MKARKSNYLVGTKVVHKDPVINGLETLLTVVDIKEYENRNTETLVCEDSLGEKKYWYHNYLRERV